MIKEDQAVGVIFEHHLLVPETGEWATAMDAVLREDFRNWLEEYVGFGYLYPIRGWDGSSSSPVKWAWYDDRLSRIDTRQWKRHGFKILFLDPRRAVLAKLTWGGREINRGPDS